MPISVKLLVTVSILTTLLPTRDALACQPPYPYITSHLVLPPDGADAVPLDARIIVLVEGNVLNSSLSLSNAAEFAEHAALTLTSEDGIPIETALTSIWLGDGVALFLKPIAPLRPHTRYVVRDRVQLGGAPGRALEFAADARPVAHFTTGEAATSDSLPAFGEVSSESSSQACDSAACCGPFEALVTHLRFPAPPHGALARIEKRHPSGEYQPLAWVAGGDAFAWRSCTGGYFQLSQIYSDGTFRLRYEGVSPTLGEPSEPFQLEPCAPPYPDWEPNPQPEPRPGTGPGDEDPRAAPRKDEGCGASTRGLFWLGLLALVRRAR